MGVFGLTFSKTVFLIRRPKLNEKDGIQMPPLSPGVGKMGTFAVYGVGE
jgi:hypothetical protein